MESQVLPSQETAERLTREFQGIQQEIQAVAQKRQKLEAQRQENEVVQQEFNLVKEGETVYKAVGPLMLKKDLEEAKLTVTGRLDFISKELRDNETSIKALQEKLEAKKMEILAHNMRVQQAESKEAKAKGKG